MGANKGKTVFLVETENMDKLSACNFRRELFDFASENFGDDFYIGHDEQYMTNVGNNFVIAIQSNLDIVILRAFFEVR
jgi:hypothetical protein